MSLLATAGAAAQASATPPDDPQALYQQGLGALAAGQPDQARQLLERVVEIQPNFAGAWLDLALATHRSGDPAAAVEHLEYLRSQFSLPPVLATQVNHWLAQWQAAPQPADLRQPPGWQGLVMLASGYDTNANTGLSRQYIDLTLNDSSSSLELDPIYHPRADGYGQVGLSLTGPVLPLGRGQLATTLLLRSKTFAHEHGYNTVDLQPGLRWLQPAAQGGQWQAHLLAQHYRTGGQSLFNGVRLHLQRTQPWPGPCASSTSASLENRWHLRMSSLGGTLYGAGIALGCQLGSGYFSVGLKAAQELARSGRTGGNNRSAEISLNLDQPLSTGQALQLGWLYNQSADQSGYSPLLQNNAARHLQQHTYSLAVLQPLHRRLQTRLSLEHFRQTSNLPLFNYSGTQLTLALIHTFE